MTSYDATEPNAPRGGDGLADSTSKIFNSHKIFRSAEAEKGTGNTMEPIIIVLIILVVLVFIALIKTVQVIPQARAGIVERFGKYKATLTPGLNIVVPFVDKVRYLIDLREQVVRFPPQPVITEDNLVVSIDTVIYFQVTDPGPRRTRSPTTSRPSSSSP